jgi:hypothetical protein
MVREELSKRRSDVIEKFINIESIINAIISQHYFKKVLINFYFEVLYDEYFSFALRRRILTKIVSDIDKDKLEKINRLNTIRNFFAHSGVELFEGKVPPEEGSIGRTPNPRKQEESLDFDELYKEFQKIEPEIASYLMDIYENIGGQSIKK